jgi:hypothetical protein
LGDIMPDYCTCGTQLVEDARFCHRCGRPTSGIDLIESPPPPLPTPQITLQEKLAQLPVSFSNPIALRVGFLMSLGIMFLDLIPGLNVLFVIWWLGGGWGGVILYRRLTGRALSVSAGARLGSITGVLAFVSMAIVFTLTVAFAGKQLFEPLLQQDPAMSKVVNDPAMLAAAFLFGLFFLFTLVVGVCAAGGALGARFNSPRPGDQV